MSFHVGQKVACVDDSGTTVVSKGSYYVVRGVGGAYITLVGVHGVMMDGMSPSRFRPVIERSTDIGIFTEMLKTRELVRVSND